MVNPTFLKNEEDHLPLRQMMHTNRCIQMTYIHADIEGSHSVKEHVNCVSMSEYGLDCQSRHSKSCVVNDGSLSTEVLRVTVGYRGTRSKTFRFMFRSKRMT